MILAGNGHPGDLKPALAKEDY